ncbi:MAG: hypothetical protein IJ074_05155, partial [Clostridia bacterium]|nr:hypothetical protein [Clostridia bacterium]
SHGVAGILAGGLLDYIVNSVYIAVMLIGASEGVLFISRFCSLSVSLPLWSIVSLWHEEYTTLGADVVVMLLAGPFLIPTFQFLGYIQGPRLWKKTEQAMAAGRRRAKARSRIAQRKPQQPKIRKPEI